MKKAFVYLCLLLATLAWDKQKSQRRPSAVRFPRRRKSATTHMLSVRMRMAGRKGPSLSFFTTKRARHRGHVIQQSACRDWRRHAGQRTHAGLRGRVTDRNGTL